MAEIELGKPEADEKFVAAELADGASKSFRWKEWIGCFVILGVIAGVTAYLVTRPEDLELTFGDGASSPLSVVRVIDVTGGVTGTLLIQRMFSLSDPTNQTYFLNMLDPTFPSSTNVSLQVFNNASLGNISLTIENIQLVEFPYMLPDSINPFTFDSVSFLNEADTVISSAAFDPSDVEESVILKAELDGSYSIDGSITMMNVVTLKQGSFVEETVLIFQDIDISAAPAAFLYLSTDRSFSESGDTEVPIEGGDTKGGKPGHYTKKGDFTQILSPALNLNDYETGRW
eukprot:CAMPEP_0184038764 /NCGR_PEP_ID=MMETSP0955-20130417/49093_1 /TAXON_ID=627963 /ORGANISM="Aplanochytrium sp, Strain PBS07" /LENGTH=286 /DNA_ID=CAMNT_0026327565 /DNA_START=40 /DNA_END=897 /DNA_ORIENTATION=-